MWWRKVRTGVALALIGFSAYVFIGLLGIGEWLRLLVWLPGMIGLYLVVTTRDRA